MSTVAERSMTATRRTSHWDPFPCHLICLWKASLSSHGWWSDVCGQGHPYVSEYDLNTACGTVPMYVRMRPFHAEHERNSTQHTTCQPRVLMPWATLCVVALRPGWYLANARPELHTMPAPSLLENRALQVVGYDPGRSTW